MNTMRLIAIKKKYCLTALIIIIIIIIIQSTISRIVF